MPRIQAMLGRRMACFHYASRILLDRSTFVGISDKGPPHSLFLHCHSAHVTFGSFLGN
ncbi:hypothetical protein M378DRAFT_160056 [Amanita muscaria Koide BX008]|uniref:Uncharacterized protein n=1 Tax=Amanita muscaria (strain Koide BX008) TaxID=946122 RepID=A0A0C2SUK1_AMAMK|nr:hypothetical protein M378DRAFT_160056 [Amanita muscaria Koide BX008]